jgi:hypothetical protein
MKSGRRGWFVGTTAMAGAVLALTVMSFGEASEPDAYQSDAIAALDNANMSLVAATVLGFAGVGMAGGGAALIAMDLAE